MFENVLGQSAVLQLSQDIEGGLLAPAMLFHGPPASGKGTCALELARFISCEHTSARASWKCDCPACLRHKNLLHPDMLCMGSRFFSAEIAASSAAFLRESENTRGHTLFVRSVRKLLARFNPALWEDEPKLSKIIPYVTSLEEGLDMLGGSVKVPASGKNKADLEKITEAIVKDAARLEGEGISDTIPVAQIRRAAAWAHLRPSGRGKIIIIENADRMQDGAMNSLLKLLEEPPLKVTIALAVSRPTVLLPTILSRLRPYRFSARDEKTEMEVIRRVFRNEAPELINREKADGGNLINRYLDSFLAVSAETLDKLAAFFAASSAKKALLLLREKRKEDPESIIALGKHCAPIAEDAGLGRPVKENREVIAAVVKGASDFENRSMFRRFLQSLLNLVSQSNKLISPPSPDQILYIELWKKCIEKADNAVSIYNQSPALALERLFTGTSRGMAELCGIS
ncbi:MAG: DNA polymerase III subunit [Treponema sp.]|nr:DNA polymerase III subunit [Treponema sp.]